MKALILNFLFAILTFQGFSEDSSGRAFREANMLLANGRVKEALEVFGRLQSRGFQSASLYNNMAIAFKKNGETGKAVLYIEKALLLSPFDKDLRNNRKLLVSTLKSSHTRNSAGWVSLVIAFSKVLQLVSVVLFFISSVLFLLKVFYPRQVYQTIYRIVLSLFIVFASVFAFALIHNTFNRQAIVVSKAGEGKTGPALNAQSVFLLQEGERIRIVREFEGWYKVENAERRSAWVLAKYIEPVNP